MFVADAGTFWNIICGLGSTDNLLPPNHHKSIHTDEITDAYDYIIHPSDDAQSIIEGMSANETARLARGASWTLTSTFDIPANITLDAGPVGRVGAPGATFVKSFDRSMATIRNGLRMHGIEFDGNKANHTGDGLADATNGVKENFWEWVWVHSNAGDNRVMDGHYFSTFDACRFSSADGVGIKLATTGSSEVSQNTYRGRTQISKNGGGGVHYEDCYAHEERYEDVVVANNNGDAFYLQCDTDSFYLWANVEQNARPVVLFDEWSDGSISAHKGPSLGGRIQTGWQTPANLNFSSPGTRTLGEVSIQGTAAVDTLNWDGKIGGATDADVPLSDYGDRRSNANIHVNRTDSGYSDDCRVNSSTRSVVFYTDIMNGTVANGGSVSGVVYKLASGGVTNLA